MSAYPRPRLTGATIFGAAAPHDRGSMVLVDEVDRLRDAVRATRAERPLRSGWRATSGAESAECDGGGSGMRRGSGEAGWTVRGMAQAPNGQSLGGGADNVRDANALATFRQYCWRSPATHGSAAAPEEWPWSSVRRTRANDEVDPL